MDNELSEKWRRFYPWLFDAERDCSWESPGDADGIPVSSDLDALGRELPDPTPTAPPIGHRSGPSLSEFVHRMIHNEISRAAAEQEFETFAEADDFDIEDDPLDPLTPYEEVFMPKVRGEAESIPPAPPDASVTPQGSPAGGSAGGGGAQPPGDGQTGPVGSPRPASGPSEQPAAPAHTHT